MALPTPSRSTPRPSAPGKPCDSPSRAVASATPRSRSATALVMIADEYPEMNIRGPKALGGSPVTLHVRVDDVDAVAARAVAAGDKLIFPHLPGLPLLQRRHEVGHRPQLVGHAASMAGEQHSVWWILTKLCSLLPTLPGLAMVGHALAQDARRTPRSHSGALRRGRNRRSPISASSRWNADAQCSSTRRRRVRRGPTSCAGSAPDLLAPWPGCTPAPAPEPSGPRRTRPRVARHARRPAPVAARVTWVGRIILPDVALTRRRRRHRQD